MHISRYGRISSLHHHDQLDGFVSEPDGGLSTGNAYIRYFTTGSMNRCASQPDADPSPLPTGPSNISFDPKVLRDTHRPQYKLRQAGICTQKILLTNQTYGRPPLINYPF